MMAAVPVSGPATHLFKPTHVLSHPTLEEPLGKEWSVARGAWTPADGVITGVQIPAQHHPAVLHIFTGPANMAIECDFKLPKATSTLSLGCDGSSHVGRIVIMPKLVFLAQNSKNPATNKPGMYPLSKQVVDLKPGEWQHLRLEYSGDKLAAWVNDTSLTAEHPYLATPKKQWGFAVSDGVQLRHIKVSSDQPMPPLPPPAPKPAPKPKPAVAAAPPAA